jgi:hypothetical protein
MVGAGGAAIAALFGLRVLLKGNAAFARRAAAHSRQARAAR